VIALFGPVLDGFLFAFCRVSGFMLLLPGFASLRVPMRVRLFIAAGIAVALAPNVELPFTDKLSPVLIACEVTIGVVLGILARVYFLALNFAAVTMASFIGLAAMPGVPVDTDEAQAALPSLITLSATAMVFFTGLHAPLLMALAHSYSVLKPGVWLEPALMLDTYQETLSEAFMLALQLAMPFLAYGLLINLGIGLANKMSPQVPVYFISMPFVISGGLILLYGLGPDVVMVFMDHFALRLRNGWF
jgi:flagellar biosynthesis protein FliR